MERPGSRITYKYFRLDLAKVKRVQKILGVKSDAEAIDRALDLVISDDDNQMAIEAKRGFIRSGIEIRDVYGKLAE